MAKFGIMVDTSTNHYEVDIPLPSGPKGSVALDRNPQVAAAVIVSEGRVLLVRRRVPEESLRWQFPAGRIDPGEGPPSAAVREAFEESALVVAVTAPLGKRLHPATGRLVYYFACEVLNGTAAIGDDNEISGVAWCARSEIQEFVPLGFYGPVQEYLDRELPGL